MAIVATYPPTPFVYNMGGLYPGKTILISGLIPPKSSTDVFRFNVRFESKPWGPDSAFYSDFRIIHKTIVLNNLSNNSWGPEEIVAKDFPLAPKEFFEMTIIVEKDGFKVSVNNNCPLVFKNRMNPLEQFKYLRIEGDVCIKEVRSE